MVDYFSLALSHGILLLAFWRLMLRDDLDREPPRAASTHEVNTKPEATPKTSSGRMRRD